MCVPSFDWSAADLPPSFCSRHVRRFARTRWPKIDVGTFSWQKALGGEAGHGMIVLSPRAVERLEQQPAPRPLPKIFRLTKSGTLIEGIFKGETINTPSMLAVEDWLVALDWAEGTGGLPALIARADANAAALDRWVQRADWIEHLVPDPAIRSNTLFLRSPTARTEADAARQSDRPMRCEKPRSIGAYRDAPPGLRMGGATVDTADIEALGPWLDGLGADPMTEARVLSDAMDPRAAAIFHERGIVVDEKPGLSPDELSAIIGDYDGLAVRSSTRVTAPVLDAAVPRLKVIGRAGIGVDTIDVAAASARGIVVMNTPFGNSITTGSASRAVREGPRNPAGRASTQAGGGKNAHGNRVRGKRSGCRRGNIGSIVADRAQGMKRGRATTSLTRSERSRGVERRARGLLRRADFISLHTPRPTNPR